MWRSKTRMFDKNMFEKTMCVFPELFPLFKGPGPGWGPVRVGAYMGPYGPIWPHKNPDRYDFVKKSLILMTNHKIC